MKTKQYITTKAPAGVIIALAGILAWALVSTLPLAVLKASLILTTLSLPVVFWVGWNMGSRKAETFLAGVDRGAGAVIDTGVKVSRARAATSQRAWREPQLPPLPVAVPDAVETVHLSGNNGNEVVVL